ncbi:hypothetical protein J11TS1_14170 [Oceanobacillus sp. J11TS1]|nr:hypothetical protein J11TS1_14170 [Oceanobacillus sp. J11TS1]
MNLIKGLIEDKLENNLIISADTIQTKVMKHLQVMLFLFRTIRTERGNG